MFFIQKSWSGKSFRTVVWESRFRLFITLALAFGFVLSGAISGEAFVAAHVKRAVYIPTVNTAEEAAQQEKTEAASVEEPKQEEAHEHSQEEDAALTLPDGRKLRSMGSFRLTGYCSCYQCSEGYGNLTATGGRAAAGRTVAVDPRLIPYGTHLLINGHEYIAEDCGGAIKKQRIDIYFNSHREASNFLEHSEVFIIE